MIAGAPVLPAGSSGAARDPNPHLHPVSAAASPGPHPRHPLSELAPCIHSSAAQPSSRNLHLESL